MGERARDCDVPKHEHGLYLAPASTGREVVFVPDGVWP